MIARHAPGKILQWCAGPFIGGLVNGPPQGAFASEPDEPAARHAPGKRLKSCAGLPSEPMSDSLWLSFATPGLVSPTQSDHSIQINRAVINALH